MNLNARQREVVEATEPKVVCVASPGSGKTRVLIEAVAAAANEVSPDQVLAITFTRYAAAEMRRRLDKLLPKDRSRRVTVGTFHAVAHDLLCQHWKEAGFQSPSIIVYDRQEQRSLLEEVVKIGRNRCTITQAIAAIECLGTHGALHGEALHKPGIADCVRLYLATLKQHDAVDYNTILYLTEKLLRDHATAGRWTHVFVDEAQDLCHLQHEMLAALRPSKLLLVADPDQLIYAWRGADVELLREQAKSARVILLEENYRSAQPIIEGANRLIAHNTLRIPKTMVASDDPPPGDMNIIEGETVEMFKGQMADGHLDLATIAILARTRRELDHWSGMLNMERIPHRVVGRREKLLERESVKNAMALLAFPDAPNNPMILARVLLAHGCNQADIHLILHGAKDTGQTCFQVAVGRLQHLGDFYSGIEEWGMLERLTAAFIRLRSLTGGLTTEEEEELVAHMSAYVRMEAWAKRSPGRFLSWMNLRDGQEEILMRPGIHLMTVHAAKGLEFDDVYIVGLDDETLPMAGAHRDALRMEEERRILFVAMTRARHNLFLLTPTGGFPRLSPFTGGPATARRPSRFISECLSQTPRTPPPHATSPPSQRS